jgi:uncharacterized protein
MTDSALKASQLSMARYLRNPRSKPPPAGIEPRRLKIYADLVYNNIEGFISGGFPVLRSLYGDADWNALVRVFIDQHSCHTPYFLEISQEFVHFVMHDYQLQETDPPFLAELAHYEWVELALDISEEVLPSPIEIEIENVLAAVLRLSPLAWVLCYRFPVNRIGVAFRPAAVADPSYLVVYRNRADEVRFIELNAATARLLELIRDNEQATAGALLAKLAAELELDADSVLVHGIEQLKPLIADAVVLVSAP